MSIDLRKELSILLEKSYDTVIIRRMSDIKCNCWRIKSLTPDPECPNCEGSGYIYNEHLVTCKMFSAPSFSISHAQDFDYGVSYSNTYVLYFNVTDLTDSISIEDLIYELKIKQNGEPVDPIIRTKSLKVIDSYRMNLDDGGRELVKVYAKPMVV